MKRISQEEFNSKIKPIKQKVFVNSNPFGNSFSDKIEAKLIIFNCSYQIESPLLDVIIESAILDGDNGFYLSSLWISEENTAKVKQEDISLYLSQVQEFISQLSDEELSLADSLTKPYDKNINQKRTNHFYIPFSEINLYSSYENSPEDLTYVTSSENILLSPKGKWGIITSHEHHALIGGTQKFIDRITSSLPAIQNQVYEFLEYWKYHKSSGIDVGWIPPLIEHIYGKEKSRQILKKSKF